MCLTRGMNGGRKKGGDGYHASCARTHLCSLFSCFCHMMFCFLCKNFHLRHIVQYICAIVFKIVFWNYPTAESITLNAYMCL